MQRALALEAQNVEALRGAARMSVVLGRPNESVELSRRLLKLDPLNLAAHMDVGIALLAANELDQAAETFRYLLELDPQLPFRHYSSFS